MTPERRALAIFSGTITTDHFHVITWRRLGKPSFADAIKQPFLPFTPALWLLLLASLAYAGVLLVHESACTLGRGSAQRCPNFQSRC